MIERWHNATDMRVSFCVDQVGIAVAGAAPNAWTLPPILFVKHYTERRVKWVQSESREIVAQWLDARIVTDRRIRKCPASVRLSGIFPGFAMYMINAFCLGVVRLQLAIRNRPGRRESAEMFYLTEVFFTEPE